MTAIATLELFLFENDAERARQALGYGVRHFLVDWEAHEKEERQKGYDTEIRPGTIDDLRDLSELQGAMTWCRINRYGPHTVGEIEHAIDARAGGIFLPMVMSPAEVEAFLRVVDGRCETGILVETMAACECARDLAKLPFERVYFGLNDFAISRGADSIFRAVLDGSVERVREIFSDKTFGFGGITAVDAGDPVPAVHLLREMARLGCRYGFMRRSFRRDLRERNPHTVISDIHDFWQRCQKRDVDLIQRDRRILEGVLLELCR